MDIHGLEDLLQYARRKHLLKENVTKVIKMHGKDMQNYLDDRDADMEIMRFEDGFNE